MQTPLYNQQTIEALQNEMMKLNGFLKTGTRLATKNIEKSRIDFNIAGGCINNIVKIMDEEISKGKEKKVEENKETENEEIREHKVFSDTNNEKSEN